MAVEFEVIRVAAATSTGIQTINTTIRPKGVMMLIGKATADGTQTDDIWQSMGFTDGRNAICIGSMSEHGVGISNVKMKADFSNDVVLQQLDNAAAVESVAEIDSFFNDSIRINWTTAPAAAYLMTVIVFGGTEVEADVGTFVSNVTQNSTTVVTTGFNPDLVLFLDNGNDMSESTSNGRGFGFGASDQAFNQGALQSNELHNQGNAAGEGIIRTGRACLNQMLASSNSCEMTATASTSFTMTTRDGNGATRYGYMALFLSSASAKVRVTTTPASVSSVYDSSYGFEPIGAIHVQTPIPSLNVVHVGFVDKFNLNLGDSYTVGAFTDDDVESHCWYMDDANTTMHSKEFRNTGTEIAELFVRNTPITAVKGVVPTPSTNLFQANGIEINWTTLDSIHGINKYYIQVAIANDPPITFVPFPRARGLEAGHLSMAGGMQ